MPSSYRGVEPSQLVYFQVENLLGQFDHEIRLSPADGFAIIYGPNGVGKTQFLLALERS